MLFTLGQSCASSTQEAPIASRSFPGILNLHNGKLTAHIARTPLRQVINEVGRLSGAQIRWFDQADDHAVSVHFTALPVVEALERLLPRKNFLLLYASPAQDARLTEIWITSRRSSVAKPMNVPPPPNVPEDFDEDDEGLAIDLDGELATTVETHLLTAQSWGAAQERIEAIELLGGLATQDARIRPLLQQLSVTESDLQVRAAAAAVLNGLE